MRSQSPAPCPAQDAGGCGRAGAGPRVGAGPGRAGGGAGPGRARGLAEAQSRSGRVPGGLVSRET